jgi:hypothetical protein
MGRIRGMNDSSPKKSSLGTLTMYKTFYKSQKVIQKTSPKDKTKRIVETVLQFDEDNQYKLAEKEMKRRSIDERTK